MRAWPLRPERMLSRLLLCLLLCLLLAGVRPAQAASYAFPGAMPPGCTQTAGTLGGDYTCGALSLGYHDTITINGAKPAILRINGNLGTDTSSINDRGTAAELTIIVSGTLTPGYQALINASVVAGVVSGGSANEVTWGGSVSTSTGKLEIGYRNNVAGSLGTASGAIVIGQSSVVSGDATSSAGGTISVGYAAEVRGVISSTAAISLAQSAIAGGRIDGGSGTVAIGYAARVTGAISTTGGSVTVAQNAVAQACVQVNGGNGTIQLGYQSQVAKVCCGGLGSCGSSCVQNSSTYAMPALCSGGAPSASLHHLELKHASGTGLTCTPSTLTVQACQDAACSSPYTGGVSGALAATGGSVAWPAGSSFSIAAGSSSTTVAFQATTTSATMLGVASSSPTAGSGASCNFGSPACTFTAADAGFLFDVPNHVSETAQTVAVSAVRKSDGASVCVPAFASTSKAVVFSCSYANPTSGTLPVRVGGAALNAGNSSAAACDASGRAVTLNFNASGVASTNVVYADVGQLTLAARYTGAAGGSEAGLVMQGSDGFIAAPNGFTVSGIGSGPLRAGSPFSATVSAVNALGTTTPNYGRETSPAGASLAWTRIQPTGSGAVNGSFSGSLGSFSAGSASASNLSWSEVGRGDLLVLPTATSGYLGSGLLAFGASPAAGARACAAENGSCVIPASVTATVYYGANSTYNARTAQSGTVACNSATFGNPLPGVTKRCFYVPSTATNGSVGDFIPHHLAVAATAACGSFSYAGQPFSVTVTAQNASGGTTLNFDGTASTSPNFAQAMTLSDATPLNLGSLSGPTIAASAFSAGVGPAQPAYAFTSKTTAPHGLLLRAGNGLSGAAAISSQGWSEATMPLRSGRLRLSNAFGSANAALQLPVVAEYWNGSAWLLNSADSCTALAAASVALSNPRGATGGATTAVSSASAVSLASGSGLLTLAAPTPAGASLSLDVAINLGSSSVDQSCHAAHPASTGAARPWLRAQNGSCAASADRDPAARASFGIFSPETRKTVHVREIF